jgi:hypothetical protein
MKLENGEEIEFPVFSWSYAFCLTSLSGGQLHAWPHCGYFSIRKTRSDYNGPKRTEDPKVILKSLKNCYGWDETPPYIEEVGKDIRKTKEIFEKDISKFIEVCKKLEEKYKEYGFHPPSEG